MRLLWFNLMVDADDPILGFTTSWISAMAKRVEFIYVITMYAGRIQVPKNVRVYSIGREKGYDKTRRIINFYRHLFFILKQERIDVCFSHMIPIFSVLAAPVLKIKHIPVITWYAHRSLTWVVKAAHHLSNRMVASLPTAYPYKHDKLTVVGQGINTNFFSPDKSTSAEDPPIILCVGRLSPVKDHPTLIHAISLLHNRYKKPFRNIILGGPGRPEDGQYIQSIFRQINELNLKEIITIEPPLPMTKLTSWYRRSTVHVNLTPTGFGDKVAWESMACGLPCIMANAGFRETLGKYAKHLYFDYRDAEGLASCLEWVLRLSATERNEIGIYLRLQVERLHSLEGLTNKLFQTFLLESNRQMK